MSSRLRSVLVVLIGIAIFAIVADRVVLSPAFFNPRDFVEYWAAGRVNAHGGNPYDPAELLQTQQLADPGRDGAVMMWNPPWSLAVYMPLGLLPPRWAALLWIGLQLAAVIASCNMLWRVFGGPERLRWLAVAIGLTFAPVVWMVLWGQNTGFVLLGLAGFAYFRKLDRPALAGAFAALTALKPHLLAVFGVLLVLDAITHRGRIALATGAGVIGAAFAFAWIANPDVLSQYRQTVTNPAPGAEPLDAWVLPVASYWLRVKLGIGFWVQFAPCLLACIGYAIYRFIRSANWNWTEELPWIVWVSVLATPYGGWIFDLTVLLVPVLALASRNATAPRIPFVVGLVLAHLAITAITLVWSFSLPGLYWVTPAVLMMCIAKPRG